MPRQLQGSRKEQQHKPPTPPPPTYTRTQTAPTAPVQADLRGVQAALDALRLAGEEESAAARRISPTLDEMLELLG